MKGSIAALVVLAGVAHAEVDPALARLEQSLPAGWTMLATDTELVIRHDRPCYVEGEHLPNEPAGSPPTGVVGGGPMITLELRYRLEPKGSAQQLADARATNDKVAAELRGLRAQYKLDKIHTSKGQPLPRYADERSRLDAYTKAEAKARARLVRLPLCTLGASSVIDGDDTYAQLRLTVDPPEAMAEAHRIVELVKKQCGG